MVEENIIKINKLKRGIELDFLRTAIRRQVISCIANKGYKAAIYTSNSMNSKLVARLLIACIDELKECLIDAKPIRINQRGWVEIRFKNGSLIFSKVLTESARGMRLNDVICDERIDKDVVYQIALPMLRRYNDDIEPKFITSRIL